MNHAAKVHRYEGLGSFRYALEVRDDAGHDVWSLPAECDSLVARAAQVWQAEIERLTQHSVILNRVSWQLHDALGMIPEGADRYSGDIEATLPMICQIIKEAHRG